MVVANASNAQVVSDALAERLDGFTRRPRRPVAGDRRSSPSRARAASTSSSRSPTSTSRRSATTAIAEGTVAGIPAQVARTGYTGEDGFELFVDVRPGGRGSGTRLLEAGRAARARPGAASARATRCAWRRACRSTATSSTGRPTPFEAGLGPRRQAGQAGRLRGPRRAREGRGGRADAAARGARRCAGGGSPGTGTRCSTRRASTGVVTSAAPCRPPWGSHRDGLRRSRPCRTRYDARRRDPRRPVAAEVVPLPFYKRPA